MKKAASSLEIRAAVANDAEAIARLAGELGYPSTTAQIRERLNKMAGDPLHSTFVALAHDGEIVGWIQLSEARSLVTDARAEIAGLVVDSRIRGKGVGRLLIERGEAWARERGLTAISLRSNVIREGAHEFYLHLGYTVTKSQKVFHKSL